MIFSFIYLNEREDQMNKIIPFNKDITFNDKIGEITSIALDDTLKFVDKYAIKGELIVRGCHKYLDKEEEFSYPLPVEISVDNKYNTEKATIMIDDFYYEIINDNILRVKIDLILDDLYYEEAQIEKEVREVTVDDDKDKITFEEVIDVNPTDEQSDTKKESNNVLDLFKEVDDTNKEYSVYRVYTVTDNDTIDSILNKYKISKEDLLELNDLSNIQEGVKLIIPSIDE